MRKTEAIDPDHLKHAVFSNEYHKDGVTFDVVARVPIKFKHCCGDMAHQKLVARVKHNIGNVIRNVLGAKKERRSLLQRVAGYFKSKCDKYLFDPQKKYED